MIERRIGPLSTTIRASLQGRSPLTHRGGALDSLLHAETQRWIALAITGVDEVKQEPTTNPFVPTRRDDCDRQFGDIFGDKAVAVVRLGVRPIPSRTHWCVLFCNQSIVAWPRPSSEIHANNADRRAPGQRSVSACQGARLRPRQASSPER